MMTAWMQWGAWARVLVSGCAVAAVLTGCGGGSGVGGGQDPDPVVLDVPIAYVRRPLVLNDDGDTVTSDLRNQRSSSASAPPWAAPRSTSPAA
jgi:hypothetical protein